MSEHEIMMNIKEKLGSIEPEIWRNFLNSILKSNITQENIRRLLKRFDNNRELASSYVKYKEKLINQYSSSKSLLYKNTDMSIYEFYIDLDLEYISPNPMKKISRTIKTETHESLFEISNKNLIIGTAGSGKTTLLKHLFLNTMCEDESISIFFELKNLNKLSQTKDNILLNGIIKDMEQRGFKIDLEVLKEFINGENVFVFLDGFDEVDSNLRRKLILEINSLSLKKCNITVTSRPNRKGFLNFDKLTELHVKTLTERQSTKLVRNLCSSESIEEEDVERFIEEIIKNHSIKDSFLLSNPLMITILLLAYSSDSNIPDNSYVVYDNAYNALYSNHDSSKSFFRRKKHSNLGKEKLKKVLRYLSALTYFDGKEDFSSTVKLKETLKDVQKYSKVIFNSDDVIEDLVESICIILKEGDYYEYVHKSFLEYFTAEFLIVEDFLDSEELYNSINSLDMYSENRVFEFMYEINKEKLMNKFIEPFLNAMQEQFVNCGSESEYKLQFYKKHIRVVEFEQEMDMGFDSESNENFLQGGFGSSVEVSRDVMIVNAFYDLMKKYEDVKRLKSIEFNSDLLKSINWFLEYQGEFESEWFKLTRNNSISKHRELNVSKVLEHSESYKRLDPVINEHFIKYKHLINHFEKVSRSRKYKEKERKNRFVINK